MDNVYIAPGAQITGDVRLGKNVGVWYNSVIRGDHGSITIGDGTNIQDNSTIHTEIGHHLVIGKGVTIGHAAIIHGEEIGDNSLIGMGAILLNGTRIGKNCIIGAGALVTQGTLIPDGSLAFGSPAKVIRPLTGEETEANRKNGEVYVELMKKARRKHMTSHTFTPQGVCSVNIRFDLDEDGKIYNLKFKGGCDGNLKAIGRLLEGTDAAAAADRLRGNLCRERGTSCADQLAKAIDEALAG